MRELRIYRTLQKLSPSELKGFRKFIESPFFNVNDNLNLLFDYYEQHIHQDTPPEKVLEPKVWQDVFGDRAEDFKQLRHWNNYLTNLVIEYFAQVNLRADTLTYNNLKYKGIGQKKELTDLIEKTEKKHERYLDKYPDLSSEYFQARFEHERIYNELISDVDRKKLKSKVEQEVNWDKVSYNLDQFYIIEKLKLYITLLGWKKSNNIEKEVHHIDEIKQILDKGNEDNAVISAYVLMVKILEEPDQEAYFLILKNLAEKERAIFSNSDYKDIYDSLLSYCAAKVNKGSNYYKKLILDIYKKALKLGVLLNEGQMSSIQFGNIVTMACRNLEYNWAESFANDYAKYLDEKSRNNTLSFSLARINYYKGNYHKVINILQKIEYETVVYNLNSKSLLLSSYYDLQEYDALDSLLNAFKVYINREKSMSSDRKKRYTQLINFTKRIANVNPRDKKKIASIKAKIQETKSVLNKAWLLEKITELESVNSREQLLKKKK